MVFFVEKFFVIYDVLYVFEKVMKNAIQWLRFRKCGPNLYLFVQVQEYLFCYIIRTTIKIIIFEYVLIYFFSFVTLEWV